MTSQADEARKILGDLVEHLERKRTAGLPGATLEAQKAHREGFTAAIKAVASSRLLLAMLEDPDEVAAG